MPKMPMPKGKMPKSHGDMPMAMHKEMMGKKEMPMKKKGK